MVDVAKLVFEFDATSAATAEKQIDKLAATSDRLEQAAKRARDSLSGGAFEQATRSAGAYEQSLKALVGAYQQGRDALGRFTGADGAFQMSQAATAKMLLQNARATEALAKEQDRAAKRIEALTRAYDPLQAEIMATNRMIEEAIKLQGAEGAAVEGLRGKLKSLEAAHSGAAGAAKLQTYQLLNLGRQGADVFVSLASGQALWMVAIQQGAQIGEIFAEAKTQGVGLKAALAEIASQAAPIAAVVAPLAAIAGVLAIGVDRALDNERAVRKFTGQLALNADGLKYNATALADTSRELSAYGVSLEDAQRGLTIFMKDGVDATRLKDFSVASKNLADVIGGDLKAAQDNVSKAFTGGMDAVDKLDQELKFLTASQRAHISAMYDAGQASAAQAEAFRIFSEQVDDAANKARGPWEQSVRDLSSAWSDFLDNLSETGAIRGAVESLQILMNTASAAFRMGKPKESESAIPNFLNPDMRSSRIKGLLNPVTMGISALGLMGDVAAYQDFQKSAVQGVGDLGKSSGQAAAIQNESTKAYQRILGALDEQLANAEKVNGAKRIQLAGENAVNDAISKGVKVEAQLNEIRSRAEAVARVSVKRDEEAAARRGASAANRALREDDATLRALDQAKRAELTAQIGLAKDIEVIAGLKKQAVDTELADRVEALKRQDGMNKINGALIPAIKAALEQEASYKKAAIDQQLFSEQLARRRTVEDTIAGYTDRQSQAQAALATSLEQAQAIENKAISERQQRERDRRDFDLFMEWADGKKTAAEVEQVQSAAEAAIASENLVKAQKDRLAVIQRDLGLRQSGLDNIMTIAQSEMDLARSAGQRQAIEARIMAARHDYEVASIKAAIEASSDADQKAALTKKLAAVDRAYSNQVKAANSAERAYQDITSALDAAAQAFESNDWARATAALFDAFDTFSKKLKTSGATLEGKIGAIAGLAVGIGNMVGGAGGSALSGAGSGAMAGLGLSSSLATLGLAVPGPGWALAAGGAVLGAIGGLFGSSKAKKQQRAQEAAQRAAEEAQRQQTIADTSRALEISLLRAQGKELEAVAKEREAELAKLSALSPALAAQQQAVYAALDLADEQAKAAKLTADQRSLDIQLLEVMGRSEEALTMKRADLLAATDPLLRATQAQIFAEEDLAKKRAKQAEIVNAQASIQDRIDAITKTSAELLYLGREKELKAADALDASLGPMLLKLWEFEDAATKTAEATAKAAEEFERLQANQTTNIGLMRQLMAMDDAVLGTTSARDAARADELAKLDATGQYLQKIVWAREDEADRIAKQNEAMAKAAELLKQRTDLENQLLVALGMTALATERQRTAMLESLDPSLRGYQTLLYGVEDATAAVTAAESALADARSAASQAYEREASALQQTIDKFKSFAASLKSFRGSLDTGGLAMNDPMTQYARTKADFERVAGLAASGNEEALGSLQGVSEAYLEASKNAQATNVGYFKDLAAVKRATEAAQKYADQQVDQGTAQLNALNAQVSALGILNQSTLSVGQAVTNVAAAIDALARATSAKSAAEAAAKSALSNAGVIPKATESLNDTSRQVMISANDNAALAAAKVYYNSANGGVDSALFNRYFANDPFGKSVGFTGDPEELRRRYGFATGGSFTVGGSGPPDSQVFPLHLSPGEMVKVSRPGESGNAELVAELRALRQEVAELKAAQIQTTINTGRQVRLAERWDGDGLPETRSVA